MNLDIQLTEIGRCPLCKSDRFNHKVLYRLEKFNIFLCRCCGLEFIDPSLDPKSMTEIYHSSEKLRAINPSLERYYEYNITDKDTVTTREYERALNELALFTREKDLLEAGCGTGSFLKFAQKKGWKVVGVDSSPENIQKAKHSGIEGECSDFLQYQPQKKFDAVIFWDLIEHPQDPGSFIEKTRDLLKPGGLVLISAPHYPNILTILAGIFYQVSFGKIKFPVKQLYVLEHTSYFSLKTLGRLLEKGGFRVVKCWKTESDIDRYQYSFFMKIIFRICFLIGRLSGLKNRQVVIAKKHPD